MREKLIGGGTVLIFLSLAVASAFYPISITKDNVWVALALLVLAVVLSFLGEELVRAIKEGDQ